MTLMLGITQIAIICFVVLYEFNRKSSAILLWATLLLMFGIPHLLCIIVGDRTYPESTLDFASVFVIVFTLIYLITRNSIGKRTALSQKRFCSYQLLSQRASAEEINDSLLLMLFIVVVTIRLVPMVKSAGGLLNTSWGAGRAYTSQLSYLNSNQALNIVFFSLSGLSALYILRKKYLFTISVALLILINVAITKNRIEILPLFCSLSALVIFRTRTVTFKTVLLGVVGAIAVIYIVYGLRVFRHYGTIEMFIKSFDLLDFMNRIRFYIINEDGELALRKWFYYFIQNDNSFPSFNKGHSYIRMLLIYLPTQWSFGLKPDDFAQAMGSAIGMVAGGSMHPSLFGDCYANCNLFGVFLGVFWGLYATVIDKISLTQRSMVNLLIWILSAVGYIIIGRGSVYNGFFFVAYGIPLLILFEHVWKRIPILRIAFAERN